MAEPTTFGKYLLLRRLGQGGMAEVFLATRADASPDDPPLVIKRMLPSMGENAEFCSMFLNEARLAAQLIHPNIVRVFDLGQVEDQLYVALEFIDGADLSVIMADQRHLGAPMTARIGLGVCEALAYAHEAKDLQGQPLGVVHRDVSPDNVMVTRAGAIKLIDFGVAKVLSSAPVTTPGVIKGKYGYVAPEYMRGQGLDGRVDLFSLGAVLYEALTGTQPFERPSPEETMARVLSHQPPPPSSLVPSCPEELSSIVMRALEKTPECRYVSARQMAHDLKAFLDGCGEHMGAAELAALVWGPSAKPQEAQPRPPTPPRPASPKPAAGAFLTDPPGPAAQPSAADNGPPTIPLPSLGVNPALYHPTRRLPVTEAPPSPWLPVAKGAGLAVLLGLAALLGRLTAPSGDSKPAAAAVAAAAADADLAAGLDASADDAGSAGEDATTADADQPGPDASQPGPDASAPRDAGGKSADAGRPAALTVLQIKGRGNVLVDGKTCHAPCAVRVLPGPHLIERGGKRRLRRTIQVPEAPTYVFTLP